MKKLHGLILYNFFRSFFVTFFISVFVFLMIFIFVYIDEFVGKNIATITLLKLFYYFSLNTITRALPLAILLSSIMTIGNMVEYFEVTAAKSAGISFYRFCRPLLFTSVVMGIFLFLFSNFILPYINLQMERTLKSIRISRPTLLFKEGAFNNDLKGYSIKIGKILDDGQTFEDILIYDHSEQMGNITVLSAKRGRIQKMDEDGLLVFTLEKGSGYKEVTDSAGIAENNDFIRDSFESRKILFDLSKLDMKSLNGGSLQTNYTMLSMWQIETFIDSVRQENLRLQSSPGSHREPVRRTIDLNRDTILKYTIEWHKRVALALSCVLMFFIGAPMGYVIKKGGLGMPIVTCMILYILYHTISITGEKLAEDESLSPITGIWLATLVLLPPSLLLYYLAGKDRIEVDIDWKAWKIFKKKNR
jgi:lipopolysaccharide export system permease protein